MRPVSHVIYLSQKHGNNPISGAENHILTLVTELTRCGADAELIVLLWNDGSLVKEAIDTLRASGVKLAIIVRPKQNRLNSRISRAVKCWYQLFKFLRDRRHRIIHIHLDFVPLMLAARLARCPYVVVTIHNDERYFAKAWWRVWLRVMDRWARAYVAITEYVRTYYLSVSGIAPEKMSTVYYGVGAPSPSRFTRRDFGIPEKAFVVGFVGRLTKQKNVGLLVKVLATLPKVCGVIVGGGELRDELEGLAKKEGATNVLFLGAIPHASHMLCLFDVLCLPSFWEGLGLVLLEAMQRGVPIVGSKAGAIPEILGNGKYGLLFDPYNSEELRLRLIQAQRDRHLLAVKARMAQEYVRTHFSIGAMVAKTLQIYEACR
jgi:glycosyltransferase involved in cell wall biosynthesis